MLEKNVTAIGEILFDVYPDAKIIGGAPFNFVYHIWKLTGKGNFISRIGEDDNGKKIINFLEGKNFPYQNIQVDPYRPTGTVHVTLDDRKVPSFDIIEDVAYDHIMLNDKINALVELETELFYFGTLARRSDNATRKTVKSLLKHNTKNFCDLNLRGDFYDKDLIHESLNFADVLKVNKDELMIINDLFIEEKFDLETTPGKVMEKYDMELLCITLGAEGAILLTLQGSSKYGEKVDKLVDTVGAGDAYSAMLAIGWLNKWDLEKTNRLASKFAAAITQINGAIPDDDDIYNKFKDLL